MILYIEVEVYDREFNARLLLATEASLRGFIVYILSRDEMINLLNKKFLLPGIYHLKDANCSKFNIEFYKKLNAQGILITAQDEEAGIMYDDYLEFIERRFSSGMSLNYFEKFFCFGQRDFEILNKKFKKKIFCRSGSPRFDLCNQNFYSNKNHFLKKKNLKNYILISSSIQYSIGWRSLADQYHLRINNENETKKNLLYKENNFFIKFRQSVEQIPYFIKLIIFLSEKLEEYDIVIRPHPNEKIETWIKLLNRAKFKKRIKIIKDDTLAEYINFSECLIQSGCTSAIEANINKKKIISFIPNNFKDSFDTNFVNSLGALASNEEEVINLIKKDFSEFDQNKLSEFEYRIDLKKNEKFSFENIVDHFCEIRSNKKLKIYNKLNKLDFYIIFLNFLRKIKKIIMKSLLFKKNEGQNFTKFPDFKQNAVKKILNDFNRFDNKFKNVNFKILSAKILKIYSVK